MKFPGLLRRVAFRAHREERGFTLVEGLIAGFILSVGAFAVAQALSFGLKTSGQARQRDAAQRVAQEQMELARSLNYQSLKLDGNGPLVHDSNPDNPDYYVSTDGKEFDPDGDGTSLGNEELVFGGADPDLKHTQNPKIQSANTTFEVYDYVTWADVSGAISGNQDAKRVTVVVTWTGNVNGVVSSLTTSSLFTNGIIPIPTPTSSTNHPPSVQCPTVSTTDLTADLTTPASDSDAGDQVARWVWDFGDGQSQTTTTAHVTHTYLSAGTYTVVVVVYDTHDAGASTASLGCPNVTVTAPTSPPPIGVGPTGTVVINANVPYTKDRQVTLTLSASSGVADFAVSEDGVNYGSYLPYPSGTNASVYTISSPGDGTKTIFVKYRNGAGQVGTPASDAIILDTGPPPKPSLTVTRSSNKKSATLTFSDTEPSLTFIVYKRAGTSGTFTQLTSCTGSPCADGTLSSRTSYTFYVVAQDQAGNQTASNQVTV